MTIILWEQREAIITPLVLLPRSGDRKSHGHRCRQRRAENALLRNQSRLALREDFLERLLGPVEGIRDLIPFHDEGVEAGGQVLLAREVDNSKSLSLENAKPLLDLVQPRAVDRCEMKCVSRMIPQPSLHELALVRDDIIQNQVHATRGFRQFLVQLFQQFDKFKRLIAQQ